MNATYSCERFLQVLTTLKSASTRFLQSETFRISIFGKNFRKHKVDTGQSVMSIQVRDFAFVSSVMKRKSISGAEQLKVPYGMANSVRATEWRKIL